VGTVSHLSRRGPGGWGRCRGPRRCRRAVPL